MPERMPTRRPARQAAWGVYLGGVPKRLPHALGLLAIVLGLTAYLTSAGATSAPSRASGPGATTVPDTVPASARSAGCATPAWGAGERTVRFAYGGQTRTALVHLPPSATHGPAPLVLAFHGVRGTGAGMQQRSGLSRVADRSGFIAVYPDASSPTHVWNAGSGASSSGVDDSGFVDALIDTIERSACVDVRRVSATGLSNGGGFTARLACDLSDRLAGVAIVAGAMAGVAPCPNGNAVSVLEIHGTDDPTAKYWGRNGIGGTLAWLARWLARDDCDASPTVTTIADRVQRMSWSPCAGGTAVQHLVIKGGLHQWPGSDPPDDGPKATIDAAEQIWRFLAPRRLTRAVAD